MAAKGGYRARNSARTPDITEPLLTAAGKGGHPWNYFSSPSTPIRSRAQAPCHMHYTVRGHVPQFPGFTLRNRILHERTLG